MKDAKLGDAWAWAVIYREMAGPVTGFLRVRGVAAPEDAASDVFFEIARNIDRFSGSEDAFRTRVFVIAYQRMVQDKHSLRPSRSQLADRALDRIKRDVEVMEPVPEGDMTEEVRRAFETLTQEQRDVLSLRVVGGLSVEQTAEVVHRDIGKVRSLQRKALAKVRRLTPAGVVTL